MKTTLLGALGTLAVTCALACCQRPKNDPVKAKNDDAESREMEEVVAAQNAGLIAAHRQLPLESVKRVLIAYRREQLASDESWMTSPAPSPFKLSLVLHDGAEVVRRVSESENISAQTVADIIFDDRALDCAQKQ